LFAGVKGTDFSFAGSTKELLNMPEIEKTASELADKVVTDFLNTNIDKTKLLLEELHIISKEDVTTFL
jgi:DNA gyrase/topoisomerase IV subunit B